MAPGSGHIEDTGGSSPAVTPCIRQGGAQRRVETFEGGRWEGTLTAFFQLFSPALGQDEGNVGKGGKGKGRMVLRNEMLLRGKWHPDPAQPGLSLFLHMGQMTGRIKGHGCSPSCSQPALLPSHLGLFHSTPYLKSTSGRLSFHCLSPQTTQRKGKEAKWHSDGYRWFRRGIQCRKNRQVALDERAP